MIMGCARDIVEHVGVPRFFHSDFPLGHSAGKPHNTDSQAQTLKHALKMLETSNAPRTTVVSSQVWAANDAWKNDFLNIERLSAREIEVLREEYKAQRDAAGKLKRLV